MNQTVIVVMAKEPRPGATKTRLSPPLTYQQAAGLYQALLLDTLAMLESLVWIDLAVAFSPEAAQPYFEQVTPPGTLLLPIEGPDIGDCLQKALSHFVAQGYPRVIALNADGPSLPPAYLQRAVSLLDDHDIVFGEGHDGGYYLVGVKEEQGPIFEDIPWSTHAVLKQTLAKAARLGLRAALTPVWYDIDTIQDLQRLQEELPGLPAERLVHTRRALKGFAGIPRSHH